MASHLVQPVRLVPTASLLLFLLWNVTDPAHPTPLGQPLTGHTDAVLSVVFVRMGTPWPAAAPTAWCTPASDQAGGSPTLQDLAEHKAGYALRDLDRLVAPARKHGPTAGIYAERLLDDTLPWTRMRQVYRLLGLARRYGAGLVNTACARALAPGVINVTTITSMLEQALENTPTRPTLTLINSEQELR